MLVITYYWPPSGGAGVQRSLKFVKYLSQQGFEPVVLTVDAKKGSYPVIDETLLSEVPSSVKVIRTNSFEPLNILSSIIGKKNVPYGGFANANKESKKQQLLRWVRGNFFIPDARVGWVSYAYAAAKKVIREEKIGVVFISSPPHSSQLIGLKLKKDFPAVRWIADLRDPWTDIYYYKDLLHGALAKQKDAQFEKRVLEEADEVIVVSEPIKTDFLKKFLLVQPAKMKVIPNGYDETDFKQGVQVSKDEFVIAYVGTMADSYRPEVFFQVFGRLITLHADVKFRFQFIGNVPSSLKRMTSELGLEKNCSWTGHVDHPVAVAQMQGAHALLLIIPDTEGAEGILTGKLFEYLGAKRLIIGIGPKKGDAASIIRECEAGAMFERNEGEALFAFLNANIEKWKAGAGVEVGNGAAMNYTRSTLTKKLAQLLFA